MKRLKNKKGFAFITVGIKIIIAVVIGSVMLGGAYGLTKDTVLPAAQRRIELMLDYSGNAGASTPARITGDINDDGIVDDADVQIIKSELLMESGNYDLSVLDVNGDGNFDTLDMIRIKKIATQGS